MPQESPPGPAGQDPQTPAGHEPASWQLSSTAHLVGRDRDIAVVRALVDQAARHGGSLVVSGDAGVGKTALIETAAAYAAATGMRLLRAAGAQFEANVSFAALHQLLFPLLDSNLSRLSEVQRAALRSAFGFHGRAVPDRMTLSHTALELLAQSGTATPTLIVVDDLPWLDQASGMVLAFIARRTAGTRSGSWRPRVPVRTASSTVPASERMSFGRCRRPRRKPCWTAGTRHCPPARGAGCCQKPRATPWRYSSSPSRLIRRTPTGHSLGHCR